MMTVQGDNLKMEYQCYTWVYGKGGEWLTTKNQDKFRLRIVMGFKFDENDKTMSDRLIEMLQMKLESSDISVVKQILEMPVLNFANSHPNLLNTNSV